MLPSLTSCNKSCAAIALRTFFLLVSCISPPSKSSSNIKYAFSKLKMISNSQTYKYNIAIKYRNIFKLIDLRFQNIYPTIQHNDGLFLMLATHCLLAQLHNKNINLRTWKFNKENLKFVN